MINKDERKDETPSRTPFPRPGDSLESDLGSPWSVAWCATVGLGFRGWRIAKFPILLSKGFGFSFTYNLARALRFPG